MNVFPEATPLAPEIVEARHIAGSLARTICTRELERGRDVFFALPELSIEIESGLLYHSVRRASPVRDRNVVHLACREAGQRCIWRVTRISRVPLSEAAEIPEPCRSEAERPSPEVLSTANQSARVRAALAEYWHRNPNRRSEAAHRSDTALLESILASAPLPGGDATRKRLVRLFNRLADGWRRLFPGTTAPQRPRSTGGRPATLTV